MNNTAKPAVTKQIVCQGSYGLRKIDGRTGRDIGHIITVWHGRNRSGAVKSFLTRREARDFAQAAS